MCIKLEVLFYYKLLTISQDLIAQVFADLCLTHWQNFYQFVTMGLAQVNESEHIYPHDKPEGTNPVC